MALQLQHHHLAFAAGDAITSHIQSIHGQDNIFRDMPEDVFATICKYLTDGEILRLSEVNRGFFQLASSSRLWLDRWAGRYRCTLDEAEQLSQSHCCAKGMFLARYLSRKAYLLRLQQQCRALDQRKAELQHQLVIRKHFAVRKLRIAQRTVSMLSVLVICLVTIIPPLHHLVVGGLFLAPRALATSVQAVEELCFSSGAAAVGAAPCRFAATTGWIVVLLLSCFNVRVLWQMYLKLMEKVSTWLPEGNRWKDRLSLLTWRRYVFVADTSHLAFEIEVIRKRIKLIESKQQAVWTYYNPTLQAIKSPLILGCMAIVFYVVLALFALELNFPQAGHPLFMMVESITSNFAGQSTLMTTGALRFHVWILQHVFTPTYAANT
jgi:hypothetical protein